MHKQPISAHVHICCIEMNQKLQAQWFMHIYITLLHSYNRSMRKDSVAFDLNRSSSEVLGMMHSNYFHACREHQNTCTCFQQDGISPSIFLFSNSGRLATCFPAPTYTPFIRLFPASLGGHCWWSHVEWVSHCLHVLVGTQCHLFWRGSYQCTLYKQFPFLQQRSSLHVHPTCCDQVTSQCFLCVIYF